MASLFGGYIVTEVTNKKGGFYTSSFYCGKTEWMNINKKYWSSIVVNGVVRKPLGLSKADYATSGMFFAWFLDLKMKHCLVIDVFGDILAERTLKVIAKDIGW